MLAIRLYPFDTVEQRETATVYNCNLILSPTQMQLEFSLVPTFGSTPIFIFSSITKHLPKSVTSVTLAVKQNPFE